MTPAKFLSIIGFDLVAFERALLERKEQNHAQTPPSDEPLSWDRKGKVVTLDAAIMAAHLTTDRLICGGFRSIVDQALRLTANKLQTKLEDLAITELSKVTGLWKRTVSFAFDLGHVFNDEYIQLSKERDIRKTALDGQRDLFHTSLSQRRSTRPTRRVLSRHNTKKQRKANKRWRNHRP